MTVPHVDIVKADDGWLALVHKMGQIGPRVVEATDLEQLHRRITSMLIGEHGVEQVTAQEAQRGVRNVENTIMAAWAKGKKDAGSDASVSA